MDVVLALLGATTVLAALIVELYVFAPGREPSRREALVWSIGWLTLDVAVAAGIALTGGPAGEWTTVYLIERSLSVDNLFLFVRRSPLPATRL